MVDMAAAHRSLRVGWIAVLVAGLGLAACNQRTPLTEDSVVAPSALPTTVLPLAMFGISFSPPALFGSAAGTGTAILTRQAPAGGVVVALASADPAVAAVPNAVTIPEGADRASFPISTQAVTADRQVAITGSSNGTTATAPLGVWAVLPSFLSWFSESGESVGAGSFGRLGSDAVYTAGLLLGSTIAPTNTITVQVGRGTEHWTIRLRGPSGAPLAVGTYENAVGLIGSGPNPGLIIDRTTNSLSHSCNVSTGRFEIRELVFGRDKFFDQIVLHLDATFEQKCSTDTGMLRGEIRYSSPN